MIRIGAPESPGTAAPRDRGRVPRSSISQRTFEKRLDVDIQRHLASISGDGWVVVDSGVRAFLIL